MQKEKVSFKNLRTQMVVKDSNESHGFGIRLKKITNFQQIQAQNCGKNLPNGGEFHGDESLGIESVKKSPPLNKSLVKKPFPGQPFSLGKPDVWWDLSTPREVTNKKWGNPPEILKNRQPKKWWVPKIWRKFMKMS